MFRQRNFVLLWSAQVLSQLASNMVLAALMAVVVHATGSNTANALLILTFLAPAVVFSALAGVLVERSDARLIMMAANLGRAIGTVGFILIGTNVLAILVLNFVISTISAFFAPAELIAITRLLEKRHFMAANSIFILTVNATFGIGFGVLGPLLLTTLGADAVYVVVGVLFALAALAIIPLPSVKPAQTPAPLEAGKGPHPRGGRAARGDRLRPAHAADLVVAALPGDRGLDHRRPRRAGARLRHDGPGSQRRRTSSSSWVRPAWGRSWASSS